MASRAALVPQPHLYIADSAGRPLDYGMVYFGQPNKDPEFYPINVFYDEALSISAMQPIRSKGGFLNANGDMVEVYAAEQTYSVKVLDAHGVLVFYKPEMRKTNSDGSISVKLPYVNTVTRPLSSKNSDTVSVKDFGAIGDGVADDASALQAALAAGVSLHWGNNTDVYRVTTELSLTATNDVYWSSNGANIFFDAPSSKHSVIYMQLGGFNLTIDNKLNINANRKAFTGLRVFNESSTTASNVLINNIHITNCHRATTAFSGGDGMYIRGNLDSVILNNPYVKNVSMAASAGISSSNGVTGITIIRNYNTEEKPHQIRINNPYIEEVYSEDLAYTFDQDGIKVFTSYERNQSIPNDTDVVISGGYFKNCLGRSIKSQCEFTKVKDCHFVRTRGFTRGYGNFEIDFQVGNGSVEGITFLYDTSRPDAIVFSNSARGANIRNITGLASIKGIKGSITNLTSGFSALLSAEAIDLPNAILNISDIDIQTDTAQGIGYLLVERGSGGNLTINISDVKVRLVTAVVSRFSTNNTNINLTKVVNTRITECIPVKLNDITTRCEVSCMGCQGLSTQRRIVSGFDSPNVALVNAIAPANNSGKSGMITPINNTVAAGGKVTVGDFGYARTTFIAALSLSTNIEGQVLLAGGGTFLKLLTPSATITVSSDGTLPASGTFRFYIDNNLLKFFNTASYEVVLTGLVIG